MLKSVRKLTRDLAIFLAVGRALVASGSRLDTLMWRVAVAVADADAVAVAVAVYLCFNSRHKKIYN